jgi:L-ribulokinase
LHGSESSQREHKIGSFYISKENGMSNGGYVIGADFGTDSVRTVIFDAETGAECGSHVALYKRWGEGAYCDPAKNRFRQHPLDYIEGLKLSMKEALRNLPKSERDSIVGIGIDTTGSTPAPVDREGRILAMKDEFKDNPNAMFILWKDHTAVEEAEEINHAAKSWEGTDFTKYEGGVYSSEWFWAKILHVLRNDPHVREAAYSWVEHADWMPALLTGTIDPLKMKRSRCAAGHKAMWHEEWGGLPDDTFLEKVDPLLQGLKKRLYRKTYTSDAEAGALTEEWAGEFGVPAGAAVAVGAFDAHMGAVGTEIREHTFVMILGTSACDMAVCPKDVLGDKLVGGICGQVDGSIIPGMVGLEAGQSGFGDVFAWFRDTLLWPLEHILDIGIGGLKDELPERAMIRLSEEAARLDDEMFPIALDWLNGRRTPYADQKLKGALIGLTLGTTAPKIFKALVEATAFGARAIIERFEEEGVSFDEVVASGGIPKKSPYVMQVLSNVLNIPVKVAQSDQAGALGAAMFASCAGGVYGSVKEAQQKMGSGFVKTYHPEPERSAHYRKLYSRYKKLGTLLGPELIR